MTITEIQGTEGSDKGIYMVKDGDKTFIVFQYHHGFALATQEGGYLQEIEGTPDLRSYIEKVMEGDHKNHPLSVD